ncbi:g6791 [Coccomyxa elongata]
MSGKARRVPLAHLRNGIPAAEGGAALPQGKLKGPKGRLALLKEENARFCAPKTRIPTPAPKKKSSLVIPIRDTFVSKIPSPKGPSLAPEDNRKDVEAETSLQNPEQDEGSPQVQAPVYGGSSTEAVTPEAQLQRHTDLQDISSDVLQLSQEIADQLAATSVTHPALDAFESPTSSQPPDMDAPQRTTASSSPQVAGMGTPQDFASTFNLEELDCSTLLGADMPEEGTFESTPAAEEALKAWLAANTPSQPGRGSAYTGSQTPGKLLATPAMQGLLQQLRISTPALGAHGVASTPFLAGLARTLPQLTPGMTPDTAAALWRVHLSSPAAAETSMPQSRNLHGAEPAEQADAEEEDTEEPALPDQAQGQGTPSDAWAELVDLTPGPREYYDISLWVSPCSSSPGSCRAAAPRDSPSFADGCPAVSDIPDGCNLTARAAAAATGHKKHVSWGSDTEHSVARAAAAELIDRAGDPPTQQDAESVGSASPLDGAKSGPGELLRCASDSGVSRVGDGARLHDAVSNTEAVKEPEPVRVGTPVNPAPAAAKPAGIGRGSVSLPRAAESCEVIHPPPVPSTPARLTLGTDELLEGTLAPANTPVEPEQGAPAASLTTYQLMLAHIVGGAYVSPTVGQPGSPATPHRQRARSYTPCLLATPAVTAPRTRSRLGPGALAGAIAAARTPATLLRRRPPRTPATQLRGSFGFGSAARGGTPGTALSVGRGSLDSWLARTGLDDKVDSPARASLEALWARAGQAGALRLEIETVRVAEQERALEEARHHLQQWDSLMQHNADLEAENAELRAELAAVAAAREAAEAALSRESSERAVAAEAAVAQQALAAAEAERCKETGLRLLELADHAALVAAAYEDEKQALLEELAASRQRLAAAQDAATCAHMSPATSDRHLAAVEAQLSEARREYTEAMAACEAAQEAAAAAAEEKVRLLTELQQARTALDASAAAADSAGASRDAEAAYLAAQLKEAHEALFELEMDALEAQRIAQETQDILAIEDSEEPIVADEADIKEMQQVVEAASDANKAYEEENERLRMELEAAQQQLAAVQQKQSSLPAEQLPAEENCEDDDSTPTKRPSETAALVGAAAAAHAAPVTFYGSHRVFLAPRPIDAPASGAVGAGTAITTARRQGTPQSASPVAAWCTVTDRLRRLRADLEDTSNTMHLLRSARKSTQQALPAPDWAGATDPYLPENLPAAQPSPVKQDTPQQLALIKAPVASPAHAAPADGAAEEGTAADERQREETPEAAAERIQLVLRIGHLTPPQEVVQACTPEPKRAPVHEAAESSPEIDTPVQQPRLGLWGRRGGARKKASASEEREFRRRAAALKIRISPYFNRRRGAADAE